MTAARPCLIPTPAPSCVSPPVEYVCRCRKMRSGSDCFLLPAVPHSLPSIHPSFPPQANLSRSPGSTPRDPIISRRDRAICRAIKNNSVDEGCCSWVLTRFKSKSKTYKLAADFFSSSLFFRSVLLLPTILHREETFTAGCVSDFRTKCVCVTYLESNGPPSSSTQKREKRKKAV